MKSLAELDELHERLDQSPARPRYTRKKATTLNRTWPRIRRGKYADWDIELIYVPHEVWKHFAHEGQKGYHGFGQHGSRRLYIAWYKGEEMGKFTTRKLAQEYIAMKENT